MEHSALNSIRLVHTWRAMVHENVQVTSTSRRRPLHTLWRRDCRVVRALPRTCMRQDCAHVAAVGHHSQTNKPSRVQHVAWNMSAKLMLYRNDLASLYCSYRLPALTITINRADYTAKTAPLLYRRAFSHAHHSRYTRSSRRCTCGTASHMALLHIATPQTPSIGPLTATPLLKLPDLHLARPLHRPSTKHHVYNVLLSCYLRVLLFARRS